MKNTYIILAILGLTSANVFAAEESNGDPEDQTHRSGPVRAIAGGASSSSSSRLSRSLCK